MRVTCGHVRSRFSVTYTSKHEGQSTSYCFDTLGEPMMFKFKSIGENHNNGVNECGKELKYRSEHCLNGIEYEQNKYYGIILSKANAAATNGV
uniref:Uncharacterized protein n=1 Tax=Tanacetum cinerariifolium TaxID=118510 RepID=A0A699I562_TANCI|nr:hypothetical protein [Tanacetum cinerariifolium]